MRESICHLIHAISEAQHPLTRRSAQCSDYIFFLLFFTRIFFKSCVSCFVDAFCCSSLSLYLIKLLQTTHRAQWRLMKSLLEHIQQVHMT